MDKKKRNANGIALINLILLIVIIVIAFFVVKSALLGGPKKVVRDFVKAGNNGEWSDAFDCYDFTGMYAFADLQEAGEDDYDDFWDTYKEYLDDDDVQTGVKFMEALIDAYADDMEEETDTSMKIKKIESSNKVADHLYCVSATLEETEDGETTTAEYDFYVMKNSDGYFIVGMDSDDGSEIMDL